MHKPGYYIVNGITLYRLLAAPVLFHLLFFHYTAVFKWLLAVSFFTDAIDGCLARRYKAVSIFGSRIDSLADDFTIAAAITGVLWVKPHFIRQEKVLVAVLVIFYVAQLVLALIRYGKISSFHTYAAKLAAVLQGIFLVLLFFLDKPVYLLFYIASAVTILELTEEIMLVFILPVWRQDVKGIWWVIKSKK